jgi:uncharacterized protein YndB with AHSA1/START domain
MTTIQRQSTASPQAVWRVLSDPWSYASWVVGASRVREVDGTWPKQGAVIHHSVGAWPLLLNDSTSVVSSVPDECIVLRARTRPFGEAEVAISLEPTGSGCLITMHEKPVAGPARLLPEAVAGPPLKMRNREALTRLALIAEGRRPGAQAPPEPA